AASCGQYGNVHRAAVLSGQIEAGAGSLSGQGASGPQSTSGERSLSSALGGTGSSSLGSLGASGSGVGPSSSGSNASGPSAGGGAGAAGVPPGGGDSTGVTATSITLGFHAPVTGAAPVSAASFLAGANLYWNYGDNGKPATIDGGHVHVIAKHDHYNAS